ncbi:WD40 repeat domain-containing protein, partial [Nocardia takedensis]|uniref:WD40 repeat domain-containing protein n=1 Tax=Nocardia takedensis TaxID=259390 RepID=UPI00059385EF
MSAVACTSIDGRPVAVTGGWDPTRVWDLTTGTPHSTLPSSSITDSLRTVACTNIDGQPFAVTGGFKGTIRIYKLATGTLYSTLDGNISPVFGVACASIDGRPVAVTGSENST